MIFTVAGCHSLTMAPDLFAWLVGGPVVGSSAEGTQLRGRTQWGDGARCRDVEVVGTCADGEEQEQDDD